MAFERNAPQLEVKELTIFSVFTIAPLLSFAMSCKLISITGIHLLSKIAALKCIL